MTTLRDDLLPQELRVLPVLALSVRSMASNPVREYLDTRLNRRLIGKVLEPPPHAFGLPKAEWLPALLVEGQLQQELADHPNVMDVVVVLDVVPVDGGPANAVEIFTPLMPRGSAWDVVYNEGVFAADDAVRVIRDAAKGLAALHRLGYLHRDVKSLNIFIQDTPSGPRGVLGDFGIAVPMNGEGFADGFEQPTPWIAPEQFAGGNRTSVVSDLFGLAASLVDLMRPLVEDEWDREAAANRMERGHLPAPARLYRPPPFLPRPVRTLISSLTRVNPTHRRPATALEVANRLNVAVPPWLQTVDEAGEFAYAAQGSTSVRVLGRRRPRLDLWELRLQVNRGSGFRTVGNGRVSEVRNRDLTQMFDAALDVWSR